MNYDNIDDSEESMLEALEMPAQLTGECDRCRRDGMDLWDLDPDDSGGWLWCAQCVRAAARLRRERGQGNE